MAAEPPAPPMQFTRCPACRTVFRVTAAQLARREGHVRCGYCKSVFDANAEIVTHTSVARREAARRVEAPSGSPDSTQRSSQTDGSVEPRAPAAASGAPETKDPGRAARARPDRDAEARRRRTQRTMRVVYVGAIPLLVLLLGAQALFHYSSAVATHWPAAGPALTRLCETAGCTVRPVPDASMQYLAIDASDLHADPAHKGLLILTATVRNRASWTLAYPHMELTLTDADDRVVVRRALAPPEYAGGTVDVTKGMAARGELAIKLFIDASATSQSGYRLYLFYP